MSSYNVTKEHWNWTLTQDFDCRRSASQTEFELFEAGKFIQCLQIFIYITMYHPYLQLLPPESFPCFQWQYHRGANQLIAIMGILLAGDLPAPNQRNQTRLCKQTGIMDRLNLCASGQSKAPPIVAVRYCRGARLNAPSIYDGCPRDTCDISESLKL